ncbi:hypothetical protein PG996_008704 [Apiospora saccharicola]|uniref:Uncharacterized protein n=1 Tax=Apiospora saccharicola TaxID=335842 RepID=A0ABR1UYP3_9PEZI
MQFSYLLSAFLATLAVATPVAHPDPDVAIVTARGDLYEGAGALLETRANIDTKPYELFSKVHSGLKDKEWYVFTQKFPLGENFPHNENEQNDVQKLQAKLGYSHIELVTGQVKEDKQKKDTKRDIINLTYHHLYKQQKVDNAPIGVESKTWKYDAKYDAKNFAFVKQTTKAKIDGLKDFNDKYKKDHKTYNVDNNNCLSYVNAAKSTL